MRIVSQSAGKPSAWNRIKEVVNEGPVATHALEDAASREENTAPAKSVSTSESSVDISNAPEEPSEPAEKKTESSGDDVAEDAAGEAEEDAAEEPSSTAPQAATSEAKEVEQPLASQDDSNETESPVDIDTDEAKEAENATKPKVPTESTAAGGTATSKPSESASKPHEAKSKSGAHTTPETAVVKARNRSSSVGNKQTTAQHPAGSKQNTPKHQIQDIPTRKARAPAAGALIPTKAAKPAVRAQLNDIEVEQARLDKAEKLEMMKQEKELMKEQREYQRKLELQAREEEHARRLEEQKEQQEIRAEKRAYDKARREAAQKAISEAVAAKKDALTLEDLNKIKAQNQFADRFDGIVNSDTNYAFDPSGARGPSQTVTYSSRFVDKLSDVTDDMAISGALSVKMAKIGGSGRGSFVDSDKFKQSDLNFYISVKVTNQTVNFKDALIYNKMRSIEPGSEDHNKVYGDTFISGFQEGGEFNAIISMKVHNKAKLLDIQAEAKVALTAGPVDITAEANVGIARTNLEMNTETTIQVSWCGGGHIKPMEQPWNIQSVMQAAARFPSLVADCPQRTYAILTKYDSLRSFVSLRPAKYSPLQYENAQIYTGVLMDAFMTYKSLYKKLGDQIASIQSKTLEFEPWPSTDDQVTSQSTQATGTDTAHMRSAMGQAVASGDQASVNALKKHAAAVAIASDTSHFDASLKGLADARKYIRRQMVYIVNEVDLIEKDPKVATDEDHDEPFQATTLFETRLPTMKIPDALKPKSDPLGGKRIMAKTQTEADLQKEQEDQAQSEQDSPALYNMDQDLSTEETTSLDNIRKATLGLGKHLQVSRAAPKTDKGDFFNNLDFLAPDWQVESVTIGMTSRGCVGAVEVVYDNGLILRKGLVSQATSLCELILTNHSLLRASCSRNLSATSSWTNASLLWQSNPARLALPHLLPPRLLLVLLRPRTRICESCPSACTPIAAAGFLAKQHETRSRLAAVCARTAQSITMCRHFISTRHIILVTSKGSSGVFQ